jgi:hypothetical protein
MNVNEAPTDFASNTYEYTRKAVNSLVKVVSME